MCALVSPAIMAVADASGNFPLAASGNLPVGMPVVDSLGSCNGSIALAQLGEHCVAVGWQLPCLDGTRLCWPL